MKAFNLVGAAAVLAASALGATSAAGATLLNGSMDGDVGNNTLPLHWTFDTVRSPDTNDVTTVGGLTAGGDHGTFGVTPSGPSQDGGTYVSMAEIADTFFGVEFHEQIGQTISDFVVGMQYEISWYAANFGWINLPFKSKTGTYDLNEDNAIAVFIDGQKIGEGSVRAMNSQWFLESVKFTASKTEHLLSFAPLKDVNSYLSIDGVTLKEVAPVPLPASLPLLLAGLGGLTLLRRRVRG